MPLTCEFLSNPKKVDPKSGLHLLKQKQFPCGERAGTYRCTGMLGEIELDLCDEHRDFIISNYKWRVTKITDNQSTEINIVNSTKENEL